MRVGYFTFSTVYVRGDVMKRSDLIDYRIRKLCTERVCISRLAWFHPSQTELKDRCLSEVMLSSSDTHLIYGSNMSPSYKTKADFIKSSFDSQCSGECRSEIPYRVVWKSFFKCLIERYLHNDTKDFMQCWSRDIDLLHFEKPEQWENEMYFIAQEFAERIKVGNITSYRIIVDLSDDMNTTDFSSDGDFFRGCFMALLGLMWYPFKDCLDIKVFCGSGVVPYCFDFPDASKLRLTEIHFDDLIPKKKL